MGLVRDIYAGKINVKSGLIYGTFHGRYRVPRHSLKVKPMSLNFLLAMSPDHTVLAVHQNAEQVATHEKWRLFARKDDREY